MHLLANVRDNPLSNPAYEVEPQGRTNAQHSNNHQEVLKRRCNLSLIGGPAKGFINYDLETPGDRQSCACSDQKCSQSKQDLRRVLRCCGKDHLERPQRLSLWGIIACTGFFIHWRDDRVLPGLLF